jgi:hypothetical protein
LQTEKISKLIEYYATSNIKVSYMKFCYDVDNTKIMHDCNKKEKLPDSPQKLMTVNSQVQYVPWSIENLIDRIRSYVIMQRIRIKEYFIDFDKLRKGKVTEQKMKTVLSQLGFKFTEEEINNL